MPALIVKDFPLEKKCPRCERTLLLSDFSRSRQNPDGLYGHCDDCRSETAHANNKRNGYAFRQRRRRERIGKNLRARARARCRKSGLAYDLDDHAEKIDGRAAKGVCELTGIPFQFEGDQRFYLPSIDRIDATQGYTYGNVRIILFGLNIAFADWGEDVLIAAITEMQRRTNRVAA